MLLQPLRIPGGRWIIEFNEFSEADPCQYCDENDMVWFSEFVEDILYIYKKVEKKAYKKKYTYTLGIDLGWYPEGNPKGSFCLIAVKNDDWENPLQKLVTRNKMEIVETIEKWLVYYNNDSMWLNPNEL